MFNVMLAGDHLYVARDLFDGVLFCVVHFQRNVLRSGTLLSQFLRMFLSTFKSTTTGIEDKQNFCYFEILF